MRRRCLVPAVLIEADDHPTASQDAALDGRGEASAEVDHLHPGRSQEAGRERAALAAEGGDQANVMACVGRQHGGEPSTSGPDPLTGDVDDRDRSVGAEPFGNTLHIDVEQGVADHCQRQAAHRWVGPHADAPTSARCCATSLSNAASVARAIRSHPYSADRRRAWMDMA